MRANRLRPERARLHRLWRGQGMRLRRGEDGRGIDGGGGGGQNVRSAGIGIGRGHIWNPERAEVVDIQVDGGRIPRRPRRTRRAIFPNSRRREPRRAADVAAALAILVPTIPASGAIQVSDANPVGPVVAGVESGCETENERVARRVVLCAGQPGRQAHDLLLLPLRQRLAVPAGAVLCDGQRLRASNQPSAGVAAQAVEPILDGVVGAAGQVGRFDDLAPPGTKLRHAAQDCVVLQPRPLRLLHNGAQVVVPTLAALLAGATRGEAPYLRRDAVEAVSLQSGAGSGRGGNRCGGAAGGPGAARREAAHLCTAAISASSSPADHGRLASVVVAARCSSMSKVTCRRSPAAGSFRWNA
eukprot:scaffold9103_cov124-Isochrysis_galbana.AAC.1